VQTFSFTVNNLEEIPSPALLIFPDRVAENIQRMIRMTGAAARLRPHIKTHKMAAIIRMHLAAGITRFKCATIAEAEMAAMAGARDVLLAYQLVGPNVDRFLQLREKFPQTRFSTVVDDPAALHHLSQAGARRMAEVEVLLDLDCGMGRSGLPPGKKALDLYRMFSTSAGIKPGGLHVYDGHIHAVDPGERQRLCRQAFDPLPAFQKEIIEAGVPLPRIVAGGTPTFPFHAKREEVECSPGTCVLWDFGYASKYTDLDFLPAALLLTRVVSKPGPNRLCLDLGHKAVASESPHPRVYLPAIPEARAVMHSEEHLVVETAKSDTFELGAPLLGIPWHICPTVALYSEAVVIENGLGVSRWKIEARERSLSI
jgi:D-threonine aldolase